MIIGRLGMLMKKTNYYGRTVGQEVLKKYEKKKVNSLGDLSLDELLFSILIALVLAAGFIFIFIFLAEFIFLRFLSVL